MVDDLEGQDLRESRDDDGVRSGAFECFGGACWGEQEG